LQAPSPSEPVRLHPAALAVWLIEDARRLGLGLIPLLTFQGPARLLILVGLVSVAVLSPVARWLRFSYRTTPGTLVVEGGVLNRWRRTIPAARVQSIDIVQKLRHRAFGVVELRIEVAGGRGTEATLAAVTPAEAERVRSSLTQEGSPADETSAPPVLLRMSPKELVLAGLTGGRVAVIALLLGYLQELTPQDFVSDSVERLASSGIGGLPLLIASVLIFLFIAGAISLVMTVVTLWDFTVERFGDRLVITRGLLDRRRSQVALHRLQAVTLQQNLLRRALGLASITVVVAGRAGPRDEEQETNLLLPGGRLEGALELIHEVIGADASRLSGDLIPAPTAALWRRLSYAALASGAAGAAGSAFFGGAGASGFGLVIPAGVLAWGGWRALGHRIDDPHVVVRSGALLRQTSFVALPNIQDLRLTISPPQRPGRLATLVLGIPKRRLRAVDLRRKRAEDSFEEVAARLSGAA
jgi:putative membrane protein